MHFISTFSSIEKKRQKEKKRGLDKNVEQELEPSLPHLKGGAFLFIDPLPESCF